MAKNLMNESLICFAANISILDKIFTIDFLTTLVVFVSQFFITAFLKILFEFFNKKINKKK